MNTNYESIETVRKLYKEIKNENTILMEMKN